MDNRPLFQARWSWGPLAASTLLPIALLCFWLWPFGQILCLTFDEWLFRSLNAPLADSTTWRYIWTIGSLRPFDIVVGLILLAVLIRGDWVFKAAQVRQAFFGFLVTLLLLVVIRALFSKWVDAAGWQHKSPSMIFDDVVHLSDYYPNLEAAWELKDRSSKSFPGDHASVLLIWALFMSVFSRGLAHYLVVWGLAALFMLPRLVAGAHWGQDDYIGGLLMAVLALGWSYYTPLAAKGSEALMRWTAPLFKLLSALPLVGRMAVLR
ncbi:TPA: phosphatase PAP2 family protein [Pseudomonas putida]|uniref:phosphatase PAP2 family protein n=1 Tax=Pseudomonas putida TaxID=303 RepID=UPI000E88FB13|nr:phosphatase PAP2 family protein [Pseudomonas putida]MDD2009952.1 phosphatase PAP2 family protein [Pseudomonas putida]HBM64427.1 phosphoesterase [Pseudomonas sp.]HDS1776289.1 phosphatase PAP2 family protein [Pseudomonas putida]